MPPFGPEPGLRPGRDGTKRADGGSVVIDRASVRVKPESPATSRPEVAHCAHCQPLAPFLRGVILSTQKSKFYPYPHQVKQVRILHPDAKCIRVGYDLWARVYDRDANPLPALEEPLLRAAAGDVRRLAVLDLGCGTGRHALWLAAAGAVVTAIDFSEGMLAEARRKPGAASVRFLTHDLHEPLPFADGAFDLAVSGLVLEHIRDLAVFFAEAHRVLRSGGRAVVSAMHPAMFLRGSQARFTDPTTGEVVQPGSFPHRLGDFVMAAVRAGFRMEEIGEYAPDASFAAQYPRAEKYVGWPMLVVLRMRASGISVASAEGCGWWTASGTVSNQNLIRGYEEPGSMGMSHTSPQTTEVNFSIEPLAPRDWPQVRTIYEEGIATGQATFEVQIPSWEEWDAAHLSDCRLVARRGSQVLGWAALNPVSRRACYAGVAEVSVYVGMSMRGQGVGGALLEALIGASESRGIWTLQGATFPENTASLRLQARCGFRVVGRRERIARLNGVWRHTVLTERRSRAVGAE